MLRAFLFAVYPVCVLYLKYWDVINHHFYHKFFMSLNIGDYTSAHV